MDKVNMYIEVIYMGRAEDGDGKYSVLLEYIRKSGELATLEEQGHLIHTTKNRVFLYACIQGLKRLRRPCDLDIYANNAYLVASVMQERLRVWQEYGWIKQTTQEPVKNVDLWKQFVSLIGKHNVSVTQVKHTSYTGILRFNLMKTEIEAIEDRRTEDE